MKFISLILLLVFSSNVAFADCDFTKIVKNTDGTYTYSKELHICVGQMKQDLEIKEQQITDYKKAIELKDLALSKSEARADLWMNTSFKMEDRLTTIDSLQNRNAAIYVGLGVIGTILSVWAAGQLR